MIRNIRLNCDDQTILGVLSSERIAAANVITGEVPASNILQRERASNKYSHISHISLFCNSADWSSYTTSSKTSCISNSSLWFFKEEFWDIGAYIEKVDSINVRNQK